MTGSRREGLPGRMLRPTGARGASWLLARIVMAPLRLHPRVPDEVSRAEENVEVVRELVAFLKAHAEELRGKGLPVDEMIRTLEEQVDGVLAAAGKVRDLNAEDRFLTEKRDHLRRRVDGITAGLPPDLVDGMATTSYLAEAAKREDQRKRRGKRGFGG